MIKKTLAVLLALCIVVVAVPFVSASTTDPTEANEQFAADLNAAAGETVCVLSEDKTTVTMTKNATLSEYVWFGGRKLNCEVSLDLAGYVIDGMIRYNSLAGRRPTHKITVLDSSAKKTGYVYTCDVFYASDYVAASLFCNGLNIGAGRTVCKLSDDGLTVIVIEDFSEFASIENHINEANFALDLNGHSLAGVEISLGNQTELTLKGSGEIGSLDASSSNITTVIIDTEGKITIVDVNHNSVVGRNSRIITIVLSGELVLHNFYSSTVNNVCADVICYPGIKYSLITDEELASIYAADYSTVVLSATKETINYCYNETEDSNDDEDLLYIVGLNADKTAHLEYMPKRDGYVFKGWYYSRSGNDPVGVNDKLSDGTTIYAQWLKIDDVQKESGDPTFNVEGNVSGFGLAGAQIRTIVNDNGKTGLRFVSRVSKQLLKDLEELGGKAPEYGHLLFSRYGGNQYRIISDKYYNFSSSIGADYGLGDCKAFNVYYDGNNYNMFTAVVTNYTTPVFFTEYIGTSVY